MAPGGGPDIAYRNRRTFLRVHTSKVQSPGKDRNPGIGFGREALNEGSHEWGRNRWWAACRLHRKMVGITAIVGLIVSLSACSDKKADGQSQGSSFQAMMRMAVPVTVASVIEKSVPVEVTTIGNGEAYTTVNVKSQVDGILQQAYFHEGQDVKKGDVLFTIDPRPFQATLNQYQANLAKDEAQLKNAEEQLQRNEQLYRDGIISKDQYDTFRTNAATLEAVVQADRAAIENAQIQLGYCTIRAPIEGRTGAVMVQPGNLVKNNDVTLVTINQISPLYVVFSVPEQYLPEIKREQAQRPLRVEAIIPQDPGHPEWGELTFVNNTVDAATGTIQLKGAFRNTSKRLWPGQFVNVVLVLASQPHAIVVPSQAVQTGQQGHYVYVVKEDRTVQLVPVVPGPTLNGETVIAKGLAPGQTVVTDGQLRLFPGAKIEVKTGL
jgi:multidrug efflux system membrane fusion protein